MAGVETRAPTLRRIASEARCLVIEGPCHGDVGSAERAGGAAGLANPNRKAGRLIAGSAQSRRRPIFASVESRGYGHTAARAV